MPHVTIAGTDLAFECGADEKILDAALRQGIHLPHNCRGGACGTCKSRVIGGKVDQGWVMSFGISDEETEQGLRLLCMSTPGSDEVAVEMLADIGLQAGDPDPGIRAASVLAVERIGTSICRLTLDMGAGFRFVPGQHVELGRPGAERPYSILDAPDAQGLARDGLVRLYVARCADGVTSPFLCDAVRAGDRIDVRGPYGGFGRGVPDGPLLLLAGGTGFSPLHSIAQGLLQAGHAGPIRFLTSARTQDDLVGLDALVRLERAHANFSWTATLTREPAGRWLSGRATVHLDGEIGCAAATRLLIAGPPAFVDGCAAAARAIGVAEAAMEAESYTPRPAAMPPQGALA